MLTNEIKKAVNNLIREGMMDRYTPKARLKRYAMGIKSKAGHTVAGIYREFARQIYERDVRGSCGYVVVNSIKDRVYAYIISITYDEILRRRLDIPAGITRRSFNVTDRDVKNRLWVINASAKYHYSNRVGDWLNNASWLAGYDEGQLFAVRVPSNITTVEEALSYMKPADVHNAEKRGRWVGRQGDVYAVEKIAGDDNTEAIRYTRHSYNKETRELTHPQHATLRIPLNVKAVRFYVQKTTDSGRAAD